MDVDVFPLGPLQTNCFLLSKGGEAVAVDPGGDPGPVLRRLKAKGLRLTHILNTHFHFDHIFGNAALSAATSAPILASRADEPLMDSVGGRRGFMGFPPVPEFAYQDLAPGETEFLGEKCVVLATPGHSPGSLSFYFPAQGRVFSGDLIFERSIGRTDFPGGSMEALMDSVRRKIFTLDPATVIHSGHGHQTTVGDEKHHNPFFNSFAP